MIKIGSDVNGILSFDKRSNNYLFTAVASKLPTLNGIFCGHYVRRYYSNMGVLQESI